MSDLAQLIEEPAGGHNHGRAALNEQGVSGNHRVPLDAASAQVAEFLRSGGWSIITTAGGERQRAGMNAHRGVVHPQEHVDPGVLRTLVENELGFTLEEVSSVYRQGRKSDAQVSLRARIDARLLEVADGGGSMIELARVMGWTIKAASADGGESCDTMERALARARDARAA